MESWPCHHRQVLLWTLKTTSLILMFFNITRWFICRWSTSNINLEQLRNLTAMHFGGGSIGQIGSLQRFQTKVFYFASPGRKTCDEVSQVAHSGSDWPQMGDASDPGMKWPFGRLTTRWLEYLLNVFDWENPLSSQKVMIFVETIFFRV